MRVLRARERRLDIPEMRLRGEGRLARAIEKQTDKLPPNMFLWAAVGSLGTALILEATGRTEKSHFVGQWVAPFLLLGLYNRVAKAAGSERARS